MPRIVSQIQQEADLCPTVTLTERVNGSQRRHKMRCLGRKCAVRELHEEFPRLKLGKKLPHFTRYILRIAERASFFGQAHSAETTCSGVNVLKQVPVDRLILANAEASPG